MTAIAGRRYLYRVAPPVAYVEPGEELVVKVTRGKIMKGTADGEWRDVLGIEAVPAIGPLEPQDPPKVEDPKTLWARAIQTGQNITSWLVPMDHDQPPVPEIVVSGADGADAGEDESQTTWRELEKPGNWFRFHSTGDYTNTYFSALFWKPIEQREAQECVIRLSDGEDIHPVKVAMKWMVDGDNRVPPGDGTPRSLIGRALAEFRIWRQLDHPHIAPLYGVVLWPNIGFLSPYYTNGRILSYVKAQRPNWKVRVRLMSEVASALIYLHEKRIVYGDLKEDNVLIDHNQRAILIDFGLSMTVADAQSTPSFSGHIRYLGPEMAEYRTKSFEMDVYAYGLLILEIAIGRMARDEHGADHIAAANAYYYPTLKEERYPEFRKSKSNVLWAIIGKCTLRTPEKRPPMREIADMLPRIGTSDW
ncbi:hypothetical protein FRC00_002880, partial [Tulasnella sp. 408]